MSGVKEQAGRQRHIVNIGRKAMKAMKRSTSKARRREARRDPEDAPKKNGYKGWMS